MRVIGVTGGIACGKSTVTAWLKEQPGCRIVDGDVLSRRLTAPGGAALPLIRETFGDRYFLSDGALNRRRLGSLVFSDEAARARLDALMAPLLQAETQREIALARQEGVSLCFLDYPLLFEKGYDRICDTVWCVYLPRELQLQRLMARDQLTEEEALSRMDAVLSSDEKAARSSVVIDNSGSVGDTLSRLPSLLAEEAQKAAGGEPRTAASPRRRRARQYDEGADASAKQAGPQRDGQSGGQAPVSPSPPAQAPSSVPLPVMDRPASARRRPSDRKVQWRLPLWLVIALSVCGALLLGGVTGQALMRAYLTRQSEAHLSAADAILREYPLEYRDIIESVAQEYNLRPAFVAAIIRNESSFQPRAESNVGARGLMQLMPDTAEWIAGKMKLSGYAFDRMYDPESNIRFGCWYLRYLSGLFRGDPVCVSCAYHAGQGQVTRWLSDPSLSPDGVTLDLDRMNDGPTKTYAGRVTRAYGIYQTLYYNGADPYDVLLPRPGQ
ncbi:MAG: dephospho-CoA kinase [Clostridia bacterium]|nr:dephospho-CoA kinase [Clostridia bacterium]